ncbi:putative SUN domain-containing ossification factor [Apostichopus japonicus]|uniref:Putative SUN domain-containing ossification factor n=1 Tax=Stichopus japonicus TaxID=307972 RepID=A0A2G8JJ07_STIJA|nr:putative SUN domain-containing ossification factor [Apostichopus japonicus]
MTPRVSSIDIATPWVACGYLSIGGCCFLSSVYQVTLYHLSEDALTTLVGKEEADAGSMDSHRDETQIEAPAYAEENISDRETAKDHQEAEEEVATKDEDTLQVEEGNVTSEDLKEGEKPEGTEPVLLEDETKEQEEEEKMEEKEDERVSEMEKKIKRKMTSSQNQFLLSMSGRKRCYRRRWKNKKSCTYFGNWSDGEVSTRPQDLDVNCRRSQEQEFSEDSSKGEGSRNDIPSLRHRQFVLKDSKNYASSDCGAKILSANDEAQKPNLVLNFNRDEYMINPCSANIWFIVELCEPIQIKLLEIANLELFSSVPESFRVYTSDRFPAREWRLLGTLYAREERNLQSFLIDEHLFTKFVKIELLTFFGKEHYCPLTVVRIFGTSMDEEIDSEEPETAVLPPNPTPLAADLKENGILDHAKDAVISFVKNAAKAFTSEKKDQDCQGEDCERVVPDEVAPTPATECWNGDLTTSMPDVEQADLVSGASVCFNPCDDLESEDFLRVCAAAVCEVQDYWRIFPNCCLLVLAQTTLHLCCSISNCYLTGSSTRDISIGNAKGETPTEGVTRVPHLEVIPLETIPSTGHLIISNLERGRPVVFSSNLLLPSMSETESTVSSSPTPANTIPPAPVFSTPVSAAETISQAQLKNSAQEHNVQRTIAPTPSFKGSEELDAEISSPSAQLPSVVGTSSSMEGTDINLPTSETTPMTVPASSASSVGTPGQGSESPPAETASSDFLHASVTSEEKEDEAEVPEKLEETAKKTDKVPKVDETQSSDGNAKQEGKVTDPGAKGDSAPTTTTETEVKVDENESKTDSATAKVTESIQPQKATEPSGGGAHVGISNYGAQKDSVFMRLNNRIKSLELNLSLSSKYLEELSKSYKKQMEEMQKSFNKTVTTLTEKVVKSQEKHTTNTADISRIDGQVEELTGIVSSISIKIEDILQEVIERHLFLMICEVLFFCSLFMICVRRERNQLRLARAMYEHHLDAPQRRNTMCASNPSQHSPRGSLRRGGTLRPSGSLDDLLIIGPTTPLREAMKANSGHQTKVKPKKQDSHSSTDQRLSNGSDPAETTNENCQEKDRLLLSCIFGQVVLVKYSKVGQRSSEDESARKHVKVQTLKGLQPPCSLAA